MRSLLTAGLLLAPTVVSAWKLPELPEGWEDDKKSREASWESDFQLPRHIVSIVDLEVPASQSPDVAAADSLSLRVQVVPTAEVCGAGSLTINGNTLPQELSSDATYVGKGPVTTEDDRIIDASWEFKCVESTEKAPLSQYLKFIVDSVNGQDVKDVGFTMSFRQQEEDPSIMRMSTDLATDGTEFTEFPKFDFDGEGLEAAEQDFDIESEIAEIEELKRHVHHLHRIIRAKEAALEERTYKDFTTEIAGCDSIKCVAKVILGKAKKIAHHVVKKIKGHKPPHGRWGHHGNHTRGNCSLPHHGKGNHTHGHPPPHWKKPGKPHGRPGKHHGPPPPPHGPPGKHHGPPPPHGPPGKHHGPPPPHGPPGEDQGPPPPGPPGEHHGPPPPSGPDSPGPNRPHDGPPNHGKPPGGDHHPFPPHHEGPPHGERPGPGGPPKDMGFENGDFEMNGPGSELHPPPPGHDGHHRGPFFLSSAFKLVLAGVLLTLLVGAIHRRSSCCSAKREARKARREERHRRRASRRAAKKQQWKAWFASLLSSARIADYEEKRAMLAEFNDGDEDAMGSEIRQLQNAASVVDDIISAEEGRSRLSIGSLPEYRSELGEELPEYEPSDGTEDSSYIADGFRYTPGSSELSVSPAISEAGSVRNILGDTKD